MISDFQTENSTSFETKLEMSRQGYLNDPDEDIDMTEGTHETGKGTLILKNGKAIAILKGDRNTSKENYNIDMHINFDRDEKMYPGYTVELEYNTGWFLNMKESYPEREK